MTPKMKTKKEKKNISKISVAGGKEANNGKSNSIFNVRIYFEFLFIF